MSVCERWSLPQGHPRSMLNCPGSKSHSTPQAAGQRARPASPALTHHPPTLPCRWRELGVAAVSPFPVSSRLHPRPPVCHACALSVAGLPLTGGQRERQGQHVHAAGLHVQGRAKGLARLLGGRPAAAAARARPVPHLAPGAAGGKRAEGRSLPYHCRLMLGPRPQPQSPPGGGLPSPAVSALAACALQGAASYSWGCWARRWGTRGRTALSGPGSWGSGTSPKSGLRTLRGGVGDGLVESLQMPSTMPAVFLALGASGRSAGHAAHPGVLGAAECPAEWAYSAWHPCRMRSRQSPQASQALEGNGLPVSMATGTWGCARPAGPWAEAHGDRRLWPDPPPPLRCRKQYQPQGASGLPGDSAASSPPSEHGSSASPPQVTALGQGARPTQPGCVNSVSSFLAASGAWAARPLAPPPPVHL